MTNWTNLFISIWSFYKQVAYLNVKFKKIPHYFIKKIINKGWILQNVIYNPYDGHSRLMCEKWVEK
jgi:hypothetical protein